MKSIYFVFVFVVVVVVVVVVMVYRSLECLLFRLLTTRSAGGGQIIIKENWC